MAPCLGTEPSLGSSPHCYLQLDTRAMFSMRRSGVPTCRAVQTVVQVERSLARNFLIMKPQTTFIIIAKRLSFLPADHNLASVCSIVVMSVFISPLPSRSGRCDYGPLAGLDAMIFFLRILCPECCCLHCCYFSEKLHPLFARLSCSGLSVQVPTRASETPWTQMWPNPERCNTTSGQSWPCRLQTLIMALEREMRLENISDL